MIKGLVVNMKVPRTVDAENIKMSWQAAKSDREKVLHFILHNY
jgi:hypothetical protein